MLRSWSISYARQLKLSLECALDYVSVIDADTLESLEKLDDRPMLIAVAAYLGKIRLIDNTTVNSAKKKDGLKKSLGWSTR